MQKLLEKKLSSSYFINHKEEVFNIEKSVKRLQESKYLEFSDEQGRTELHIATIE